MCTTTVDLVQDADSVGGEANGDWVCYVCRNGLAVVKGRQLQPKERVCSGNDESILLLGGELEDVTTAEPPLAITLSDSEVAWIRNASDRAVAATWYGPHEQGKSSNQDFALSASIQSDGGKEYLFAAVADGVSTKTFWAARSARLACLTAMRVIATAVTNRDDFDDQALTDMRVALASSLKSELARDKATLIAAKAVPEGWDEGLYHKHVGVDAYWYNTTLLTSVLSDDLGFVLFSGDGGIQVRKRGNETTDEPIRVLKSDESLEISSFVSLSVTAADFQAARFADIASLESVNVILATDGVDRTLQMGSLTDCDYEKLDLSSPASALSELKRLGEMPKHEMDNYSIARLTWIKAIAPKNSVLCEDASVSVIDVSTSGAAPETDDEATTSEK